MDQQYLYEKIMNIIIIDDHSGSKINGIGTYIRELILILKQIKVAAIYFVACNNDCKKFSIAEDDGICKLFLPPIPYTHSHMIIEKFIGLYIKDSVNNLFLFNYGPCENLLLSVKKRFPLSKMAFTIHDMTWTYKLFGDTNKLKEISKSLIENNETEEYKKLGIYFREEQRMFGIFDRLITLAQETSDILINVYKIDPQKIVFIPNGIEDSKGDISINKRKLIKKSKLLLAENEKIILFVGRIHYIKGIYSLIKAFEMVLRSYPNCRLVLVGTIIDFPEVAYSAKNISSKITFTGQLTRGELMDWYEVADIGVLPSYVEQCSYTGIEMMMYQIPVVASDGFCVKEMFKHGLNSFSARIGNRDNPEEFENNLKNAILELLNSENLTLKIAEQGRATYEARYDLKYMQKGYVLFLNQLLSL